LLRPSLEEQGRPRWPAHPKSWSWWSLTQPHTNLPVPGLVTTESVTEFDAYAGVVQPIPQSLQPAYGSFSDQSPNGRFGGGPGGGVAWGNWGGIAALVRLDPSRAAEATPGLAPRLPTETRPLMDFRTPPSLGELALKIPAGP
jgi:hypothetical protein